LEAPERTDEDRLLPPWQVRKLYGVAASTLRDWDSAGKLKAAQRTLGGHRRYRESEVRAQLGTTGAVA
jgi:DNA-binding transcriptional MerR regulator